MSFVFVIWMRFETVVGRVLHMHSQTECVSMEDVNGKPDDCSDARRLARLLAHVPRPSSMHGNLRIAVPCPHARNPWSSGFGVPARACLRRFLRWRQCG